MGLAEKCPHLPIDVTISEPAGQIGDGLCYQQFPGLYMPSPQGADPLNEVVFYHAESRSLVITDLAFHFDRTSAALTQAIAKLIGVYDKLQLTILEKWLIQDKAAMAVAVRSILAWDFDRVIMAHGSPIPTSGKSMFKAGYEWLLDQELWSSFFLFLFLISFLVLGWAKADRFIGFGCWWIHEIHEFR